MKRISLFGRKRLKDLSDDAQETTQEKKDELLALKLSSLDQKARSEGDYQFLPINQIIPDPNQPRQSFRDIESLARSIEQNGILSPIIVQEAEDKQYVIIAGERRYRAAMLAGLEKLPCLLRHAEDKEVLLLQLLENDQRDDVPPLEESAAIARLVHEKGLSQSDVAKELGHDPAWVSIRIGLQETSDKVKSLSRDGYIEDVRTLHELKMFEKEFPEEANLFIQRVRDHQVSGAYRQVIAQKRRELKQSQRGKIKASSEAKHIELRGDELVIRTERRELKRFRVSEEVMEAFLTSLATIE